MHHTHVFHNSCQVFLKIMHVCRHAYDKFACSTHINAVITTSNSKLHHTSILGQWTRVAYTSGLRLMLTQTFITLFIIFVATITAQTKASGNSYIKLLGSRTHVINILLLTKRKRMECRWRSIIFKKVDLQVTFPAIYICNSLYIYMCHTSVSCRVH